MHLNVHMCTYPYYFRILQVLFSVNVFVLLFNYLGCAESLWLMTTQQAHMSNCFMFTFVAPCVNRMLCMLLERYDVC